jgi:hypothetical protein
MTSYRLDRYRNGKFIGSEVVDGIERADVALRLLLSNCATKHCRLYADDVLLAEGAEGSWWLPLTMLTTLLQPPTERTWSLHSA